MNVNEYAERVLLSTDLNEKLRLFTDTVEFDFQQTRISRETEPGRPDNLLLSAAGKAGRVPLPSRPSLVDDRSRGTLLHFFANHELLAAELMALALLKFPDAPVEFRKGLFQTLREEQKHTLWYLGRMKECGVELGEIPVSRFFWDTVSTMETPIDYVSRLSLTFEQANLDYSRHFREVMMEAGDDRTARILDRIYRDEIEHVGYGLKWFKHWKSPEKTVWEAYEGQLSLPLSPSRAKGNGTGFNTEGRLEAGLPEEFVRVLSIFEKSKGRTPNLFLFNPDAEDLISSENWKSYQAPAKVHALVRDLEILQIFLARQDDIILMAKAPGLQHLEKMKKMGFQLPEIAEKITSRRVKKICPWSIAPDLPEKFEEINHSTDSLWRDELKSLFSKVHQSEIFQEWMPDSYPCRSLVQAREAFSEIPGEIILKRPIAAAGRGVRRFSDRDKAISQAENWLQSDGEILVERCHHRVFDFSVQYQISNHEIEKIGLVRQLIDPSGRYRGSISSPKFCKGLDSDLSRFLMTEALPYFDVDQPLAKAVKNWAAELKYSGPLGIDAYVYLDGGEMKIRPICEINPRYTMGRVAHEIRKAVSPGCAIKFSLNKSEPTKRENKNPPEIDEKNGKMKAGEFVLNEIDDQTVFVAQIQIDKDPANLVS